MANKRILIFGKGFIGKRIQEALDGYISERKIHSFKEAQKEVKKYNPQIIINSIGHVGGNNIDCCEKDLDKTLFANTYLPLVLAEIALRNKIKFIQISTGCIYHFDYSQDKPINEEKIPNFLDLYYSRTKIYAERALEVLSDKFNILILRIRTPLDTHPHPKNILTKLLAYKRIIDTPNSVTYLPDFIKALQYLIKIDARGIYNIINKDGLRYPELLEVYKRYVPDFKYKVVDFKKLNLVRTNLVLSPRKLEESGFRVRSINEVLKECVQAYLGKDSP